MKKLKKIFQIFLLVVGCSAVAAYIIYVMYLQPKEQEDAICQDLIFNFANDTNAKFIDQSDINELLNDNSINPRGKKINDVNLELIEKAIRKCQYIDSVECYKTSQNNVCVYILQRTPVMYVMPDSISDGYFIDSRGRIIKNTRYITDLVVATGDISNQYACTRLVEFGNFLRQNNFWNNQIEQIHVSRDEKGNQIVDCIPRIGNQVIHLGILDDYETKLNRLKTFYEKAMPLIGWNHYSRFNLEYSNQIICTKTQFPNNEEVAHTDSE